VAIILATHSLIPHKEYRFIFLAIPLYLILIAPTLINLFKKKAYVVALSASLLGCAGILPGAKHYYLQPFFFNDPVLAQTNDQVYSSPNCSLFLPQRDWTYTGGSYYHHLSQIYSVDYLPKDISPHFILQPSSLSSPEGYEGTLQTNGYTLYQSDQVCHPSEDYTSIRSFKYLEPYLENIPLALK
jgi:hypothetical protein